MHAVHCLCHAQVGVLSRAGNAVQCASQCRAFGVCLQHPDFGVVSLANATTIMERMDDSEGTAADLDQQVSKAAQVGFWALEDNWCRKCEASLQW